MPTVSTEPIRVFISYSWDSETHRQRVLELAQRLRNDGVDAWLDRFIQFPPEGWQRWMENEIEKANFVLIVSTQKYAERFAGRAARGTGLGANWEGAIISTELYDAGGQNEKFLPVIFSTQDEAHIPKPLRRYSRFCLETDADYRGLYRLIIGQPDVTPVLLGNKRDLPSEVVGPKLSALGVPRIHDHPAAHSNLPHLPYGFFGREEELKKIAGSLAPDARTWGALIDGPGGIGKTALAIRAAELTPSGQFQRVIFLSAKRQELTPDGAKPLANFVVPGYLSMLNELARQLDLPELTKKMEHERPPELQRALQNLQALLIFDNLESLTPTDRDQLFNFLAYLPGGCKAVVTSRRRDDVDARVVPLGKLDREAALDFIAKLAESRELLRRASETQQLELYENTGGNPLLIRWVAGQLGRGKCKTISDALKLLRNAPAGNDPLEFIFGDLVDTFSGGETRALAALSHFSSPIEVKFIAELSGLSHTAAQTALDDLTGRALVAADEEANRFVMMPLVAEFLRHVKPEDVRQASGRLADRVYALVVENGYGKHGGFPALEAAWLQIAAAFPLFLESNYQRVQTVCDALGTFLDFSGRWDERISICRQAEEKAVTAKDFLAAGWRACQGASSHYRRVDVTEFQGCTERCERYWKEAKAGARERGYVRRLHGMGHGLAKNYPAAKAAFQDAIELWRSVSRESDDVSTGFIDLGDVQRISGDRDEAEVNFREALRIAEAVGSVEQVSISTINLAQIALDREDWPSAEALARAALLLSERIGRKQLLAGNSVRLCQALARQGRKAEALPHGLRGLNLYTELRSPYVDWAREVVKECQP